MWAQRAGVQGGMRRDTEVDGTVAKGMRTPKGKREPSRGETETDMKPRVKDDGAWRGREEYIREGLAEQEGKER